MAIATRIFDPEPSAASFRLGAIAKEFLAQGHSVRVLTVSPPSELKSVETVAAKHERLVVKRFPVLRDATGYVRGYVQYLSFDVPLFFRVLFGPKQDAIIVEPPPTSLFAVTAAAALRRIPLFAYAADVWSDASASTGAPAAVVKFVRWLERVAWSRARGVFAVNQGVAGRVREIAPRAVVEVVGNGIDTELFSLQAPMGSEEATGIPECRYALYSGTASEWQGAEVFINALGELGLDRDEFAVVFLGQGSAWGDLQELAAEAGVHVVFHEPVSPTVAAAWQRSATMSLASIVPGKGYDFAYPTKLFAAWACGTPVVFAGRGPARDALAQQSFLGRGVDYGVAEVAQAMHELLGAPAARDDIAEWARENVSLQSVARRVAAFTWARAPRLAALREGRA